MSNKAIKSNLISILTILCLIFSFSNYDVSSSMETVEQRNAYELTPSNSIEILNDSHFIDYGFPGLGNESHPYIIEELEIISDNHTGIRVVGTTKYFIIQKCYINVEHIGINIVSVAEGTATIQENSCVNNRFTCGIYIQYSPHTTVFNNTCINNINNIIIYESSHSIVSENYCTNGNSGIYVRESVSVIVANNTCYMLNNGVYVDGASANIISFNIFHLNDGYGVWIDDYVGNSLNNIIHHNKFIDNNLASQTSQGYDRGTNNVWYDTTKNEGNFWSEWTSGPYSIDGDAHSVDFYPIQETVISEFSNNSMYLLFLITLSIIIIPLRLRKR